jgi:DNA-directed RNA polymerase specialized sigma24 family protein
MTSEILLNIWNTLEADAARTPWAGALSLSRCRETYEQNRHRLYSLAFWMTGNELRAEALLEKTFVRGFAVSPEPSSETLDAALIGELERLYAIHRITLQCDPGNRVLNVRGSAKRAHLEESVLRLPSCERMIFLLHDVEGYPTGKICRLLGLERVLVSGALHQARLRLRELLAAATEVAEAA